MEGGSVDATPSSSNANISSLALQNSANSDQILGLSVLDKDALYYDMRGKKYMIIYSHRIYKDTEYFRVKPKRRSGTYEDVEALKRVFSKLNFRIVVHQDQHYQGIEDSLKRFCNGDHSNTSCVFVVILTHGDEGGELYAADRPYLMRNLLKLFEDGDPKLVTKPKLFFVQACRGQAVDEGRAVQLVTESDANALIKIPSHSNFLILCSTVEGYVSYRDRNGSWMVQALCEVVENHHQELDIFHMITMMNQKVALERISSNPNPELDGKKQMPETRHTFTKLFKFK